MSNTAEDTVQIVRMNKVQCVGCENSGVFFYMKSLQSEWEQLIAVCSCGKVFCKKETELRIEPGSVSTSNPMWINIGKIVDTGSEYGFLSNKYDMAITLSITKCRMNNICVSRIISTMGWTFCQEGPPSPNNDNSLENGWNSWILSGNNPNIIGAVFKKSTPLQNQGGFLDIEHYVFGLSKEDAMAIKNTIYSPRWLEKISGQRNLIRNSFRIVNKHKIVHEYAKELIFKFLKQKTVSNYEAMAVMLKIPKMDLLIWFQQKKASPETTKLSKYITKSLSAKSVCMKRESKDVLKRVSAK
mgnify:CR=1 FL=1